MSDAKARLRNRKGEENGSADSGLRQTLSDRVGRFALVFFLALMIAGFSIALPSTFPTLGNFTATASSQEVLLLLALAVTLPLRTGVFDISVASVMVLSAVVVTHLTNAHVPVPLAIVVGVLVGGVAGCVNAFLIVGFGVDAFITTLGTGTVLNGLSYAFTGGVVVSVNASKLLTFGRFFVVGNLPVGVVYGWVLAAIMWYIYERTPSGRYLLFVGGNADVARLAGVKVERVRASAFIAAGLISGFAGVLLASSIGAVDSSIAAQYLLPPYAAAFLSTTTIQVGRFNIVGTVIGLYLLAVGITGLELLGASPWVGDAFNGGALVLAVTFARRAMLTRGRTRGQRLLPPFANAVMARLRQAGADQDGR